MIETYQIIILFFTLPGFISYAIIRYVALITNKQSQIEIVFYSLVCSVPSYLIATTAVNTTEDQLVVQLMVAIGLGFGVAYLIKLIFLKGWVRYSPWHNFCFENKGRYVIVYTKSNYRIYGWIQSGSVDSEPRREIVLGDPCKIKNKGEIIPLGKSMLITESEIARVLYLNIDKPDEQDTSVTDPTSECNP